MQPSREQVFATDSELPKVVPLMAAQGDPGFGIAIHAVNARCVAIASLILSKSSQGSLEVLCRFSEGSLKALCRFLVVVMNACKCSSIPASITGALGLEFRV